MERYEEYKDSGVEWIGEIPAEWEAARLKTHLAKNQGGIWGSDPRGDGGTVVLRSTEQTVDGNWDISDPAIRDLSEESDADSRILEEGDLLVTKSSGSALHIGKTTIVDEAIASMRCSYSNFMQRLRSGRGLTPRFCWYLLNSDLAREQYCYLQNSTSGLGNLTSGTISGIMIPIPPVDDQEAIVSYLDAKTAEVDSLVKDCEREVELLQEYRKAVISEAVTKGLGPNAPMKDSGINWIGEIPSKWATARLGNLCEKVFDGPFGSSLKSDDYSDEGVRVVRLENLKYLYFDESKRSYVSQEKYATICQHTIYPNDLIVATFVMDSVKACSLPPEIGYAVNKADCLGVRVGENIDRDFLKYFLSSDQAYSFLSRFTHGSTRQRINTSQLKSMHVPIPRTEEQRAIVVYLDGRISEVRSLIADKQAEIGKLREYRKSLISEAVTGKFKVPGVA